MTKEAWKRLRAEVPKCIHPLVAAIQAEARKHGTDTFPLKEIEAEMQVVPQAKRRQPNT
jgi:hypothetical protein